MAVLMRRPVSDRPRNAFAVTRRLGEMVDHGFATDGIARAMLTGAVIGVRVIVHSR